MRKRCNNVTHQGLSTKKKISLFSHPSFLNGWSIFYGNSELGSIFSFSCSRKERKKKNVFFIVVKKYKIKRVFCNFFPSTLTNKKNPQPFCTVKRLRKREFQEKLGYHILNFFNHKEVKVIYLCKIFNAF